MIETILGFVLGGALVAGYFLHAALTTKIDVLSDYQVVLEKRIKVLEQKTPVAEKVDALEAKLNALMLRSKT